MLIVITPDKAKVIMGAINGLESATKLCPSISSVNFLIRIDVEEDGDSPGSVVFDATVMPDYSVSLEGIEFTREDIEQASLGNTITREVP